MNSRQQRIMQIVSDRQKVSVADLASATGVSLVTIRHDLSELEKNAWLRREHGFAILCDSDDTDARMLNHFAHKQSLAAYAASLVQDGETVFIESGSTNAFLARLLASRPGITIITVSAYIARLLRDGRCDVVVLGGTLQKGTESMVGPLTRMALEQVNFSKAFIGVDGFTAQTGFTGRDMMRADIINCVLQKGADNIVMTDSAKFGQIHPHPLGTGAQVSLVISDNQLSGVHEKALQDAGIRVIKTGIVP
ncbi:DeoR/GlpR transcriptional regulator [Enterobacteriaceae bacterium 4M9]|nr:DeoR/GlpR transcriptional regulator [Enterobacteriaceae bacterium 4M9]